MNDRPHPVSGRDYPRTYQEFLEWFAALLKRWLMSTHQGSVSGKHLDYYLDEYTFRFNRRSSQSRGMLFYRLMEQAVVTAPLPYRQIVQREHNI